MGGIFAATAAALKTSPTRDPMTKLSNINERTALGVEELVKIAYSDKGGVSGTGGKNMPKEMEKTNKETKKNTEATKKNTVQEREKTRAEKLGDKLSSLSGVNSATSSFKGLTGTSGLGALVKDTKTMGGGKTFGAFGGKDTRDASAYERNKALMGGKNMPKEMEKTNKETKKNTEATKKNIVQEKKVTAETKKAATGFKGLTGTSGLGALDKGYKGVAGDGGLYERNKAGMGAGSNPWDEVMSGVAEWADSSKVVPKDDKGGLSSEEKAYYQDKYTKMFQEPSQTYIGGGRDGRDVARTGQWSASGAAGSASGTSNVQGEVTVTVKSDDNTFKSKVVRVLLSPEAKTNLGRAVFQ